MVDRLVSVDSGTNRLPAVVRQRLADDMADPATVEGTKLSATYARPAVIVRERAYGETDDSAAFNEALTNAASLVTFAGAATVVWQPGRSVETSGGHARPFGVSVDFGGNTVTHTGNNVFLDCHTAGPTLDMKNNAGVRNLHLIGNAGAAAVALELGNSWGFELRHLLIEGYVNGVGLDLHNRVNWVEGLTTHNVTIKYAKVGVRFVGFDGGTNSFGYTRLRGLAINVPANGIGIQIGPAGIGGQAYLYNSFIEATIWLEGTNAIGLQVGTQSLTQALRVDIVGEGNYATYGGYSYQNLGGVFQAFGTFILLGGYPVSTAGTNNALPPGLANSLFPAGTDFTTGGSLTVVAGKGGTGATFGVGQDTNLEFGWVSGFESGTNDLFRVYSMPFSANPIGTAAHRRFSVGATGVLTMGQGATATNRVSIVPLSGTPNSVHAHGPGSIALRVDSLGRGYECAYVKASAVGTNTGWVPLQPVAAQSTANRPNGMSTGSMYFDTTLGKPIWWNGTAWVDAMGTTV